MTWGATTTVFASGYVTRGYVRIPSTNQSIAVTNLTHHLLYLNYSVLPCLASPTSGTIFPSRYNITKNCRFCYTPHPLPSIPSQRYNNRFSLPFIIYAQSLLSSITADKPPTKEQSQRPLIPYCFFISTQKKGICSIHTHTHTWACAFIHANLLIHG